MLKNDITVKTLLIIVSLSIAPFSCTVKEDPKPATQAEVIEEEEEKEEEKPKVLTVSESKSIVSTEISNAETKFSSYASQTQSLYSNSYAITSIASSNESSGDAYTSLPYDFVPYVYQLGISYSSENSSNSRKTATNESSFFNNKFNPLSLLSKGTKNGKSIPLDFEEAKGVWELTITTATSSPGSSYYCSTYNTTTSGYIYKYLSFVKTVQTGPSIVIKLPSKTYTSSSDLCDLKVLDNDLEYTITELEQDEYIFRTCNNGYNEIDEETYTSKINATLKQNGKLLFTYTDNNNYDEFNFKTTVKFDENEFNQISKLEGDTTLSYNTVVKSNSDIIYSNKLGLNITSFKDLFENSNCESGSDIFSSYLKSGKDEIKIGNLLITGTVDFKKAKKYIKDNDVSLESSNTVLSEYLNESSKYEIFDKDGAKIGQLVFEVSKVSTYGFNVSASIEYSDETKTEVSKEISNNFIPTSVRYLEFLFEPVYE